MSQITRADLTPGQQELIFTGMRILFSALCQAIPQAYPQISSGGTLEIKTMSGLNLKFGFEPQAGGIIMPGGIRPAENGGLIK